MPIRNFINADTVDGFHASPTPSPNAIPVAGSDGKLVSGWFPDVGLNADTVDGFHASPTPSPNTIPVAGSDGKLNIGWLNASQTPSANAIPVAGLDGSLADGWLKTGLETYSRLTVANSFPTSPNHNDLVWREDQLKLYKYDARTNQWKEIDWQNIVKASPEWVAERLRINSTTGKLEISSDGSNWFECIPAVGANAIEPLTIDKTSYSYKYWVAPGQTVIVRNANHIPICYTPTVEPFYSGRYWCSHRYDYWGGLRPSNIAINNGNGQLVGGGDTNTYAFGHTSLSIVPICDLASVDENWANFELRIRSNQRFLVNSIGQGHLGYMIVACNGSGTASSISYWLGTWYRQDGVQFSVNVLTLTRRA